MHPLPYIFHRQMVLASVKTLFGIVHETFTFAKK